MRALKDCVEYELDIPKLTKGNSFIASGRPIFIKKANHTGKAIKLYAAYDNASKVLLGAHWDKDFLMGFIQSKDLSILGRTQQSLF